MCRQVVSDAWRTHTPYCPPGDVTAENYAQKVPNVPGYPETPKSTVLACVVSCLKCSANELLELYRFFSQGGKQSQADRATCQTRADLRLLTEEAAIGPRGLDRNKAFLPTGGCCADTQSRTQSYP